MIKMKKTKSKRKSQMLILTSNLFLGMRRSKQIHRQMDILEIHLEDLVTLTTTTIGIISIIAR